MSSDPTPLLQRFLSRYRAALVLKVSVLAMLGFGILGVVAWRLQALHMTPTLTWSAPVGLALLMTMGLSWWLRRRWLSTTEAAAQLDRTLDLQQRLITAQELTAAKQAPALYPLLMDDLAGRYSVEKTRYPRAMDRTAGTLVALLVLLLLWPRLGELPGQRPLQSLRSPSPQPPHQETPPQTPPEQQRDQQQSSSSSSMSSSGQQGSAPSQQGSLPSSGGSQSSGSQGAAAQQPRAGANGRSSQPQQGSSPEQQNASQRPEGSQGTQQGAQEQSRGTQPGQAQQTAQRSEGSERQQGRPQGQQDGQSGRQSTGTAQGASGTSQQSQAQSSARQQAGASAQQGKQAAQAAGGGGQGTGNEEALKAEIQQLLKQVSGELQQLQAQLEQTQDQPQPTAGTTSDPNLYGPKEELGKTGTNPLAIQLQTDSAKTAAQRPGGGTGKPSGEVSHTGPQTQAEPAQLSDQPLQETPTDRQAVPPEYKSIFDRLQRTTQPSQTSQ